MKKSLLSIAVNVVLLHNHTSDFNYNYANVRRNKSWHELNRGKLSKKQRRGE